MATKTATAKTASTPAAKKAETFPFKTNRGNTYTIPVKYKSCTSVSQIIRAMTADGYDKAAIHKATGILYQHVRNVLMQPVKKAS